MYTPHAGQGIVFEVDPSRVGGTVLGYGDGSVVVEVDDASVLVGRSVSVRMADSDGLMTAQAQVSQGASERQVLLTLTQVDVHQRRAHQRAEVVAPIMLGLTVGSGLGWGLEAVRGHTVDLSSGGLRAVLDGVVPVGTEVSVALDIGGEPVLATGRVLEGDAERTRVVFTAISTEASERVTSAVVRAGLVRPGARRFRAAR